jgi:hypothetical protein
LSVQVLLLVGARTPAERRLDVNDRSTVDRFDRPNPQTVPGDPFHGHGMNAQRVRAIG